MLTIDGETKTLQEWSKIYGVSAERTRDRLKKGADPLFALTAPEGTTFKVDAVRQRRAEDKELCSKCKYRGYFDHAHRKSQVYCEYLFWAGHRRPCKADNCTAFIKGPYRQIRVTVHHTYRERGIYG